MASEIVMPRMGLTMEEGTLVGWRKSVGQKISAGEPLFEIETDKSTVEVEALESGVLGRILVEVGQTVPVGTVIALLVKEGEALPDEAPAAASRPQAMPFAPEPAAQGPAAAAPSGKVRASPAARRLARSLGVELSRAAGTGPGGRVVAWNVTALNLTGAPAKASPLAAKAAAELGVDLSAVQGSGPGGRITRQDVERAQGAASGPGRDEAVPVSGEVRPFTRLEQVMARRMVESFSSAPHFYLHVDVDARPLVALREQLKARLEKRAGVHLTYTDLLVYLVARALARHPEMLCQWTPQGMRQLSDVHVGVAVEAERGLLVPVLRDADRLGLAETSRRLAELAAKARAGSLQPTEQEQGVFTLSNLGAFGIDAFDAVLNPPQAAILAVGRIKERPLVSGGQVVPAAMLTLSLSVDHRVLDGARAARFLGDLAELLETPVLSME